MLKGQKLLASRAATTQGVSFLLEVLAGLIPRHDTPPSQTPSPISRHSSHFGGVGPNVAKGLTLRHDHGSNYMAHDFRTEIECFGIVSSPAFVRQIEGNGVAERAIRTLKEQLLWVQHFKTVEELRRALAAFAAQHNASWLRQRHGYKTPDQIRAEQKALEPEAAIGVKVAA
ncbi:hypothetical protein [Roseovarius sp.]|uniref:hypothetical protein n=1 Tax=Roseovarius sp. TaxID=1486281 RepID=UPI00356429EE